MRPWPVSFISRHATSPRPITTIEGASDLGLGFVGISLFYREGYFQQAINSDNWQTEYYSQLDPANLPLEPVLDEEGQPIVCEVEIAAEPVQFRVWVVNVGRCPVYLIDANLPTNQPACQPVDQSANQPAS